jgi:hypothetical protein
MPAFRGISFGAALTRGPVSLLAAGVATVVVALLHRGDALAFAHEPEE